VSADGARRDDVDVMARPVPSSADGQGEAAVTERVLLVEDDASLREVVSLVLGATGMEVEAVGAGDEALDAFERGDHDLVVLDVMLPGLDGFEVCRRIRARSRVPIVMLTARTDAGEVVRGLELGADDYVTKPFEAAVLLARVRAVLRRTAPERADVVEEGDVRVDEAQFRAWRGEELLELSATELRLLAELVRNAGQAMTRQSLLERVWHYDYLGDSRLVDMAVKRLREKVEDDPRNPTRVTTVRGVGYRFERAP
jgi:two-component system, OmpR family, response regulator MtrA